MRRHPGFTAILTLATTFLLAIPAFALQGDFRIHDPSTIIQCDGRYYCFGTGRGIRVLSSADRVTWRREPSVFQTLPREVASLVPRNNGIDVWAPDVAHLNGEYDGFYYLFVNRGSCCQGAKSTYVMEMGRSEKVTGPFLDRHGADMLRGGGSVFLAAHGNQIGPGHFGLLSEDGVDRFSYHLEYDGDHPGRPVLNIRPLLYDTQDWPMPGAEAMDGK